MSSKSMPRTQADRRLGIKHLKMTKALEVRKINDHAKAAKAAKKAGDSDSYKYNMNHMKAHKKDVKERQKSIKKYLKAKVKSSKK